jgi:uncharacterized membrane protein
MDKVLMDSQLEQRNRSGLLVAAGILIGAGLLGGFVDGILFHEILQWHHMVTSVRPTTTLSDFKANTLGDGLFHLGTWTITVIGIALLWRAGGRSDVPWSAKIFGGSLLLGTGLFDVIEGLIDHQILGIHHVKSGPHELAWDLGFLTLGAVLAIAGWLLLQSGQKENSSKL